MDYSKSEMIQNDYFVVIQLLIWLFDSNLIYLNFELKRISEIPPPRPALISQLCLLPAKFLSRTHIIHKHIPS